jgi:hypothetical protein
VPFPYILRNYTGYSGLNGAINFCIIDNPMPIMKIKRAIINWHAKKGIEFFVQKLIRGLELKLMVKFSTFYH